MKITLINPPSPFETTPAMNPPLGLCYLSSAAKTKGFKNINLIDFSLFKYDYYNDDQYLSQINLDADIYGITCVTPQYKWFHDIAKYIRKRNRKALIVGGGPHVTNCWEECLNDSAVDVTIQGYGESQFVYLCRMKAKDISFSKINLEPQRGQDINKLPFPDHSLIPMKYYKRKIKGEPAIHIITLRGCNYKCRYCDMSRGTKVIYRTIGNVFEEIDEIIKEYKIKSFVIYDDIFTLEKERLKEFCFKACKRNIKWRCFSRVDKLNFNMLSMMKESGLTSITLGIESGDNAILRHINKGVTAKLNEDALLLCKKVGIPVRCSLMYGNPGECKKTLNNTLELIRKTMPDEWNLAVLTPIPGSEFWNNPGKYGLSFDKEWLRKERYLPCNRFSDTGIGRSYIKIDSMTEKEFDNNLRWFVNELERICPRKKIQDTIQDIKI